MLGVVKEKENNGGEETCLENMKGTDIYVHTYL